jgi:hypothetical protein
VFHHATTSIVGPGEEGDSETGEGGHFIGAVFQFMKLVATAMSSRPMRGVFLPAYGAIAWGQYAYPRSGISRF